MSDKLKKFIQRSKTEFDHESPRSDLFDKIMDNVDHKKIGVKPNVNTKYAFQWMAVAASLLLLIVFSLFFYLSDNQIQSPTIQIVETLVPQKDDNVSNQTGILQTSTSNQKLDDVTNTEMISSHSTAVHKPKINSTPSVQKKLIENLQNENSISSIESTPVQPTVAVTKNTESSTIPVNDQSNNKDVIAESITSQEINPSDATVVSTIPQVAITEIENQIKENENITTPSEDSKAETIANEDTEESSSLKSSIKKGFFKLLSKKARKWSGNTLSIRNVETNDRSVLAVRYKDERVEFSKSFNLGPSN